MTPTLIVDAQPNQSRRSGGSFRQRTNRHSIGVRQLVNYLPAAGTSLSNGTNEVVGTFVPTDLVTYAIGTITNQIVVTAAAKGNPAVTVTTGSYDLQRIVSGAGSQ